MTHPASHEHVAPEDLPPHVLAARLRVAEDQLAFLATHDPLTELPNRGAFVERAERALEAARAAGRAVALVALDVDDFQLVNDSFGHDAGDRLVADVAARMRCAVAGSDFLARHSGDEFLLLLEDLELVEAERAAATAAADLLGALSAPFCVAGEPFEISAGAGVSLFPADAADVGELHRNAEAAMHEAKRAGRGEVRGHRPARREPLRRLSLSTRLRAAMAADQLTLHWQPIVDPRGGEVHAVEALVRWEDPEHGLVGPAEFVPQAEQSALIEALGAHVLELACARQTAWRAGGLDLRVSVNVSPRQLRAPGFAELLRDTLDRYGVGPRSLIVEVTESAAMQEGRRSESALRELAALGVGIAIDDFGAGYSSLARLIELPVDTLKVDRSFLARAPTDPAAAAVLASIVALGRSLALDTVAEGVETAAQRRLLCDLGCPLAQGYLLGRPAPAAELEPVLAAGRVHA